MKSRWLVFVLFLTGGASAVVAARSAPLETSGGWKKFAGNPVMGGKYGTCFDISVLREGGTYRMWLSWRPKGSVALVESKDGIHWSEPPQIVLGPRRETGWEDDINRPVVLKREDGYHLWYTGQAQGHSWIGYATSPDGVAWKRMSDQAGPVAGEAVGEGRGDVSARLVGCGRQALPDVVFRRRTERAERHRLCHQP